MRLIDADALGEMLIKANVGRKSLEEFLKMLKKAPTIEVSIEQILERLEEEKKWRSEKAEEELEEFCLEMFHHYSDEALGLEKAIKIIKEVKALIQKEESIGIVCEDRFVIYKQIT